MDNGNEEEGKSHCMLSLMKINTARRDIQMRRGAFSIHAKNKSFFLFFLPFQSSSHLTHSRLPWVSKLISHNKLNIYVTKHKKKKLVNQLILHLSPANNLAFLVVEFALNTD